MYSRVYCDLCDYAATTSSNLKQHKLTKHDGKRYYCDQCSYGATLPSDLKKHKQSKHDGIRYPCTICAYSATTVSNLNQHVLSKHKGTVDQNIKKLNRPHFNKINWNIWTCSSFPFHFTFLMYCVIQKGIYVV